MKGKKIAATLLGRWAKCQMHKMITLKQYDWPSDKDDESFSS